MAEAERAKLEFDERGEGVVVSSHAATDRTTIGSSLGMKFIGAS